MSTFLVTGATGFLGKHLVAQLLEKEHKVICVLRESSAVPDFFSHKNCEVVRCDMTQYSELATVIGETISLDGVFYLAWSGNSGALRGDPVVQQSNLTAMLDCLVFAGEHGCKKFVATGTVSEKLILGENPCISSQNMLYAASKHSAYLMGSVVAQKYELDFTWLQLANIYGEGNTTGNLTSYTIDVLLKGEVPSYGSATVWQDFMYVKDCVAGIALAGERPLKKNLYYIGSGQPEILKDYLGQIRDVIDPSLTLGIGERADDGTFYPKEWFDLSPFAEETGFQVKYSFAEGMTKTIHVEKGTN